MTADEAERTRLEWRGSVERSIAELKATAVKQSTCLHNVNEKITILTERATPVLEAMETMQTGIRTIGTIGRVGGKVARGALVVAGCLVFIKIFASGGGLAAAADAMWKIIK